MLKVPTFIPTGESEISGFAGLGEMKVERLLPLQNHWAGRAEAGLWRRPHSLEVTHHLLQGESG